MVTMIMTLIGRWVPSTFYLTVECHTEATSQRSNDFRFHRARTWLRIIADKSSVISGSASESTLHVVVLVWEQLQR